jgi:hypothetical protein
MRLLASLYLSYAGLMLLALSQLRHHQAVFGAAPAPLRVWRLRTVGGLLVVVSPLPWTWLQGVDVGLVAWTFCGLPLAGLITALMLTYRPRIGAAAAFATAFGHRR